MLPYVATYMAYWVLYTGGTLVEDYPKWFATEKVDEVQMKNVDNKLPDKKLSEHGQNPTKTWPLNLNIFALPLPVTSPTIDIILVP